MVDKEKEFQDWRGNANIANNEYVLARFPEVEEPWVTMDGSFAIPELEAIVNILLELTGGKRNGTDSDSN